MKTVISSLFFFFKIFKNLVRDQDIGKNFPQSQVVLCENPSKKYLYLVTRIATNFVCKLDKNSPIVTVLKKKKLHFTCVCVFRLALPCRAIFYVLIMRPTFLQVKRKKNSMMLTNFSILSYKLI